MIYGALTLLAIKLLQQIYAVIGTASSFRIIGGLNYSLSSQFFEKYLYFDNNKIESIGTGKLNSIILR